MATKLDKVTNIVTIITCAVMCLYLVSRWTAGGGSASRAATPYAVGDEVESIADVSFQASPATAVVFVQSQCRFCTESMPFYRELAEIPDRLARHVRIVAVSPEPMEQLRQYLKSHELTIDLAIGGHRVSTRITGTPTLIVVDRKGVIRGAWSGRLSEAGQKEVVKVISETVSLRSGN